jgi:hypothetical protein
MPLRHCETTVDSFLDEATVRQMSCTWWYRETPVRQFIHTLQIAKTPEQEHSILSTEHARIHADVRDGQADLRPVNVAKLVVLDLLVGDTTWSNRSDHAHGARQVFLQMDWLPLFLASSRPRFGCCCFGHPHSTQRSGQQ